MSERPSDSINATGPMRSASKTTALKVATVAAVSMVILALIGVGLTMADSAISATYWILMVPIYGLLCVATAWYRSVPGAGAGPSLVLRQVFHWLGIGGALGLDFFFRTLGEETDIAAGLNALLLLALGLLPGWRPPRTTLHCGGFAADPDPLRRRQGAGVPVVSLGDGGCRDRRDNRPVLGPWSGSLPPRREWIFAISRLDAIVGTRGRSLDSSVQQRP